MKSLEQKRLEAAERQAYYASLSTTYKLTRARLARGESRRVIAKLERQWEKEKADAAKAQAPKAKAA